MDAIFNSPNGFQILISFPRLINLLLKNSFVADNSWYKNYGYNYIIIIDIIEIDVIVFTLILFENKLGLFVCFIFNQRFRVIYTYI